MVIGRGMEMIIVSLVFKILMNGIWLFMNDNVVEIRV